ncbi:maleylacetoacetate isomerase [Vibrio taketomensis]|uniref:maleylacetoacetate isomerase n=1 Tax=Vibrio taketomensis TaxID=2572923 RepID=UPI00138979F5|nr:maleylacetoacetate isomerase [Vibrio taketomensis]
MKLYGYWRSSAAYRVRIALNLKKIAYEYIAVDLLKDGGEQHSDDFHQINATELVPVLVDGDMRISQSLNIIDYLDDHYFPPQLTPAAGQDRYTAKEVAQDIAIDIHPLNNLRVQQYLISQEEFTEQDELDWVKHWIMVGFEALEEKLLRSSGAYCVGTQLTIADVCLVPQVYNALRFGVDLSFYPTIERLYHSLNEMSEFRLAAPENQPDAPTKKPPIE